MIALHNILVATTGHESKRVVGRTTTSGSWTDRIKSWFRPVFAPVFAMSRQPRFAMSFGMAFFSLSISLSLAGVKASDVRHVDLRPNAIKRTYYETTGRVVKYYENIRFVYEIESRVRQLKQAAPAEERPETRPTNNNENKKKNSSGQPEKQERNYSQEGTHVMYASLPVAGDLQPADLMRTGMVDSPVVHGATYRRFV